MRAAGPDGAEGQGDHGGHRSDAAVAPAPACPTAGDAGADDDEVVL
jgi:hypothetical protein